MRIGIVGTGIAGLTAGWILKRRGHSITLFEKHDSVGMDAHSVDFEVQGQRFRSDVPPRMFNRSQWPNLVELYEAIGVEFELVSSTKSFSTFQKPAVLSLKDSYLPKLSADLIFNSTTRKILADIRTMMNSAPGYIEIVHAQKESNPDWTEPTFAEYLKLVPDSSANGLVNGSKGNAHLSLGDFSSEFIKQFLYPALSSTVCTCSYEALGEIPATTLLSSMLNITKPEGLFRTSHGTKDVVSRLTRDIDEIKLNSPVGRVFSDAGSGNLGHSESAFVEVGGMVHEFDHVVVATQANATLGIVERLSEKERSALSSFKYENVETLVHFDESLMPAQQNDWTTFNLISNPDHSGAMCTIWLNKFYPEWNLERPVFQTIMPLVDPAPDQVICKSRMQRPVVNSNSSQAHRTLRETRHEPGRRIWFTGSYATPGIPLLESGVCASMEVANSLAGDMVVTRSQ